MKINIVQLCTLSIAASPQEIGSGPLADPILPIAFPFHTAPPPTASPPTVPVNFDTLATSIMPNDFQIH